MLIADSALRYHGGERKENTMHNKDEDVNVEQK